MKFVSTAFAVFLINSELLFITALVSSVTPSSTETEDNLDSSARITCLPERRNVNKYYLFKANAAPIVVRGRVNFSNPVEDHLTSFKISEVAFLKGKDWITPGELKNSENLLGRNVLYVNLQKSPCREMEKSKKLRRNNAVYMFYLTKASNPDEFEFFKDSTIQVPTMAFFAQPDLYKKKIEKTLQSELFCQDCQKVGPFVEKGWKPAYYVTEGDNLSLVCKTQGTPLPHNFISVNDTPLHSNYQDQTINIITKGRKLVMEFRNIKVEDAGVYSCTGTNFESEDAVTETEIHVTPVVSSSSATAVGTGSPSFPFKPSLPPSGNKSNDGIGCPEKYEGFCLNGGDCYYLKKSRIVGCKCYGFYEGERCQEYVPRAAYSKQTIVQTRNPKFWTITTFILLTAALVSSLLYSARLFFRMRRFKRKYEDQLTIASPTSLLPPFDYDIPPVPKRYSNIREVSYKDLDDFETKPRSIYFTPNHVRTPERRPHDSLRRPSSASEPRRQVPVRNYPVIFENPRDEFDLPVNSPDIITSNSQTFPRSANDPSLSPTAPRTQPRLPEVPDRAFSSGIPNQVDNPTYDPKSISNDNSSNSSNHAPRDSFLPSLPPNFYELNKSSKETDIIDSKSDDFHEYSVPEKMRNREPIASQSSDGVYSEV